MILLFAQAAVATTLPGVTEGPDMTVYGYQAYWDDDLYAVAWDDLSHIAIFAASSDSSGTLTNTSRWDEAALAVQLAEPYGVHVHLCVTNFSTSSLDLFLGDDAAQASLIADLVQWQADTGAHGVNIDFEGLPSNRRAEMVDFTRDLQAAVGEVALATPAVDWGEAWDYAALTDYADLFIMGYAYHWSGSATSGPTDPLYGGDGTPWGVYSLDWSVRDYLDNGADPDRVILGLAMYGIRFPVAENIVPTANIGSGSSVFMAEGNADAATWGALYEPTSESPYSYNGSEQVWYPTVDSIMARVAYVDAAEIGGFGFWALHYDNDDPVLWNAIHDATVSPQEPTDPADPDAPYLADAGSPFLAYVGDSVVLNGEASTGPQGAMVYLWSQVGGPSVVLSDPTHAKPSFAIEEAGNHVFELTVGDGTVTSFPAKSYVIVIDRDAGRRHRVTACGCQGAPAVGWLWLIGVLALFRRRSASRL
jgi:spore germination protein YaaH